MAIESTPPLLSYEDYAAIDDDARYEVLDGELVPMGPAPFLRHQWVAGQLYQALAAWAQRSGAGFVYIAPVDVVLQAGRPATVLQPDVLFVAVANRHRLTVANVQGPPDLVVEVLSPSNARKDAIRKRDLYARFGVPEYWIVPEACDRVEVLRLGADGAYGRPTLVEPDELLTSPLLPGFELACGRIFPPDPAGG